MLSDSKNFYKILSKIDCSKQVEKKNGLSYLSWIWANDRVKELYPESYPTIYENPDGRFWFDDGSTGWVKTGFTIVYEDDEGNRKELETIEYLPIMDNRNQAIPAGNIKSTDANKSIQRSLTKAIARGTGLGSFVYAGLDLPEETEEEAAEKNKQQSKIENVIAGIDKEVARIIEGYTQEQKLNFYKQVVKPEIGMTNYQKCTNLNDLISLYTKLKETKAA